MAKRKKQSKKAHVEEAPERSAFWPYAGGVILCLLAVFVLLGGFGTGGPLPTNLFRARIGRLAGLHTWYQLHWCTLPLPNL